MEINLILSGHTITSAAWLKPFLYINMINIVDFFNKIKSFWKCLLLSSRQGDLICRLTWVSGSCIVSFSIPHVTQTSEASEVFTSGSLPGYIFSKLVFFTVLSVEKNPTRNLPWLKERRIILFLTSRVGCPCIHFTRIQLIYLLLFSSLWYKSI